MGFDRSFVRDDEKRETLTTLTLSGRPQDLFSEKFIEFTKHAVVGFLAKEAQTSNDPDKIFERLDESVCEPAKKAATMLCHGILKSLVSDPRNARKFCEHYVRTGEFLEEIEL